MSSAATEERPAGDEGLGANVLETVGVTKQFGGLTAVNDVSFAIYGFLLVIMMIMRPEGLLPERRRKQELHDESEDALVAQAP